MGELNWETIQMDPLYDKNPLRLVFYREDGKTEAGEQESAKSHELEYIGMERASEEEEKKMNDAKKRPGVKFKFIDLVTKVDKEVLRSSGTRFFEAFRESKPNAGDKIQILRTGSKMTVQYFVNKLTSTAPKAAE